jgi:hypothetical protein
MKRYAHLLSAGRETARATVPRAVSTAAERGRVCLNCAGGRVCGGGWGGWGFGGGG